MHFVLAITSYNRLSYLKDCLNSWDQTRDKNHNWTLIIADDGSSEEVLNFLESISFEKTTIHLIKNKRVGVHNQVNTILLKLNELEFDFCFKVDDDIEFKKEGWDNLYYEKAIATGFHHLVFCEKSWGTEQFFDKKVAKEGLESHYSILNAHGFFYTISPLMLKEVGYFDLENFGFRGMGHVDYTARACRLGFNKLENPFDIENSEEYITANKPSYKGALDEDLISAYDHFHRERKEKVILEDRKFIPLQSNKVNYTSFQAELPEIFKNEIQRKNKEIDWYKNTYESLPTWWKKVGAFIRKTKK